MIGGNFNDLDLFKFRKIRGQMNKLNNKDEINDREKEMIDRVSLKRKSYSSWFVQY